MTDLFNLGSSTTPTEATAEQTPAISQPVVASNQKELSLNTDAMNSGVFQGFDALSGQALVDKLSNDYMMLNASKRTAIQKPTANSTPEQNAEFYKSLEDVAGVAVIGNTPESQKAFLQKLGVPASPADYQFSEDFTMNESTQDEIRQIGEKMSLTQQQFAMLSDVISADQEQDALALKASNAEVVGKRDEALTKLWGDDKDTRLKGAQLGADHVAQEFGADWLDHLKTSGAINNPIVVMALSKLGEGLTEKGLLMDNKMEYGDSQVSIKSKITAMRSDPNYYVAGQAGADLRKQVVQLTGMLK